MIIEHLHSSDGYRHQCFYNAFQATCKYRNFLMAESRSKRNNAGSDTRATGISATKTHCHVDCDKRPLLATPLNDLVADGGPNMSRVFLNYLDRSCAQELGDASSATAQDRVERSKRLLVAFRDRSHPLHPYQELAWPIDNYRSVARPGVLNLLDCNLLPKCSDETPSRLPELFVDMMSTAESIPVLTSSQQESDTPTFLHGAQGSLHQRGELRAGATAKGTDVDVTTEMVDQTINTDDLPLKERAIASSATLACFKLFADGDTSTERHVDATGTATYTFI